MSTKHHNLSQLDAPLPSAADMKFGIVVAEWNREITEALLEGAVQTLRSAGCSDLNIQIKYVPGTFELTLGTQFFAEYTDVDAVIALGCVVQGETRHPVADTVEYACSIRYPDGERPATGIRPGGRKIRKQGQ